ncbi:hypothetical protein H112_00802 [Trichophyton rubrum D6]|uniref:Uncharacterized protein n=2 Tax=Trichophyton TaxID=5550 RepID=A0A022WFF6_TRIRU|nr:hypothetical protein H100_00801 [Trichophyton rubrum MR850]EZF46216.1 hypothetical protein H102_00792 [Trichophyton rubrum CBS 100081]EZF56886.1 hypothetical protein H103_00800 [Trichophyton rubrum CBS 288.86]EZF67517.1 hypothetical protein H104_00785 [Trichophyton rubrum CBS 289.86]EZF78180.1 hypothetical protein H105_00796 [Trichophyton soudanense CBS 452.61]EZF88837.1 hypothetical protein H110_00801 [Trichophyton rubrum MR1448]EZF99599.1 hypothetical protein H113_00802 [Trichophyton rub
MEGVDADPPCHPQACAIQGNIDRFDMSDQKLLQRGQMSEPDHPAVQMLQCSLYTEGRGCKNPKLPEIFFTQVEAEAD